MNRTKEPSLSSDAADVSFPTVGPAISEAIKSTVAASIGSLTDNLTEVIESRLGSFAKRFSEENGATVEQAVKRARRENYTCKRKGNQQQLDHELQVLDKFDEASGALASKCYDKVKAALKEGTVIVSKRVKAIKLADKSEFGWQTVNEYLSDQLASDSGCFVQKGERRRKSRTNVVASIALSLVVALNPLFQMYLRIRNDHLQAIM